MKKLSTIKHYRYLITQSVPIQESQAPNSPSNVSPLLHVTSPPAHVPDPLVDLITIDLKITIMPLSLLIQAMYMGRFTTYTIIVHRCPYTASDIGHSPTFLRTSALAGHVNVSLGFFVGVFYLYMCWTSCI